MCANSALVKQVCGRLTRGEICTIVILMDTQGIKKAVQNVGGVHAFTRKMNLYMIGNSILYKGKPGINRFTVNRWIYGKQKFPVEMSVAVSAVSGVSKRELRPDVFL